MAAIIDNTILSGCSVSENAEYLVRKGFETEISGNGSTQCMILQAAASYTGEKPPKIGFDIYAGSGKAPLYQSHRYTVGAKGELACKAWRIPPMLFPDMRLRITVSVPDGTVLKIRDIHADYTMNTVQWIGGVRHNAHLGFFGMAPHDTMPAFELAALCGFPACIVNPRVTADGVFVCLHDDTINRTARDGDGNPPQKQMPVAEMTYAELGQWEFGSHKHEIYRGTPIPRLNDFFTLCEKTGMRPMFSVDCDFSTEQWRQIREMLKKHGLLHLLNIKAHEGKLLRDAYAVFGTEIDGYTMYVDGWTDSYIDELRGIGPDTADCRMVLEVRFDCCTAETTKKILDSGLTASAWAVGIRDSDEYERLMSYGVTEFTEDQHCSMGLNW